jgi:two-component system cell cycle sensor histidine kinase/response regulator CckA
VAQADESIVITDPRGFMQFVNPAFERSTGFNRMELLGRSPKILKSGLHDGEFYRKLWDTIGRGDVWRGTIINRRKDGTLYEEDTVISPVLDRSGRIVHYVGVSRNPVPTDRMEGARGGVAHDFNNLLTAISGYCDLLLHRVPEYPEFRKEVEQIRKTVTRAAGLTRKLLASCRRQRL